MDLVNNFLLQGLDPHAPSTLELYDRYRRPFEAPYWEAEIGVGRIRQVRSVGFLSWWLTARIVHGDLDELALLAYHVDVLDVLKSLLLWLTAPQASAPAGQRSRLIAAVDSWITRRVAPRQPGRRRFLLARRRRPARMRASPRAAGSLGTLARSPAR